MASREKENVVIQREILLPVKHHKPTTYFVYFEDCGARSGNKRSAAAARFLF
jgi:hypothetical protein